MLRERAQTQFDVSKFGQNKLTNTATATPSTVIAPDSKLAMSIQQRADLLLNKKSYHTGEIKQDQNIHENR